MSFFNVLEPYGTVYSEITDENLTRFKLGNYVSKTEAKDVLKVVRELGFGDAFLTQATASISSGFETAANDDIAPQSLPIWKQLSESQQKSVIYLDGILHIEDHGQLVRLSDYARKTMQ